MSVSMAIILITHHSLLKFKWYYCKLGQQNLKIYVDFTLPKSGTHALSVGLGRVSYKQTTQHVRAKFRAAVLFLLWFNVFCFVSFVFFFSRLIPSTFIMENET